MCRILGSVCYSMVFIGVMDGFRVMEALLLITVFTGLVGLLLRRSLFLKVMGMDGMGTGRRHQPRANLISARSPRRRRSTPMAGRGCAAEGSA